MKERCESIVARIVAGGYERMNEKFGKGKVGKERVGKGRKGKKRKGTNERKGKERNNNWT